MQNFTSIRAVLQRREEGLFWSGELDFVLEMLFSYRPFQIMDWPRTCMETVKTTFWDVNDKAAILLFKQ